MSLARFVFQELLLEADDFVRSLPIREVAWPPKIMRPTPPPPEWELDYGVYIRVR